jgi:hypothetical protein
VTIRASGIHGRPTARAVGYAGEVFVDHAGVYIGDFSAGDGLEAGMPLGFAHAVNGIVTSPGGFVYFAQPYWADCSDPATSPMAYVSFSEFFPTTRPTAYGTIVDDLSGPAGFEAKKACRIDTAGSPGQFSWVGPTASQFAAVYSPYDGGWNPAHSSQWTFSAYVRAVADANGFVCDGYTAGFGAGPWGSVSVTVGTFTLTTEWQLVTSTFTWPYSTGPAIPSVLALDDRFFNPVEKTVPIPPFGGTFTLTKDDNKGSFLVKELHLYPYPGESLGAPYHVAQQRIA